MYTTSISGSILLIFIFSQLLLSATLLLLPIAVYPLLASSTEIRKFLFQILLVYFFFLVFFTDLSGADLEVYSFWAKQACYSNSQIDPALYLYFSFSCIFFDPYLTIRFLIYLNISFQVFYILKIFKSKTAALLIYFGLGNFFLSNFNILPFNLALTFILALTYYQKNLVRIFLLIGALASHIASLFFTGIIILSRFKIQFALIIASLIGLGVYFIFELIGIEARLLNYLGFDNQASPLKLLLLCGINILLILLNRFLQFSEIAEEIYLINWSLIALVSLASVYLFTGVRVDIFERLLNPSMFILFYFILKIMFSRLRPLFLIHLLLAIVFATNLYISSSDTSNGWSLLPFDIYFLN